jgi:hypothetical protein
MTALERHHDHDRALELAAMAIDFELTSAESAELHDQMAACPRCSRDAAAMRADAGAMRVPLTMLPSRRVDDAVYAAIDGRRSGSQRVVLLAAAALLLLGLLAALAVGASLLVNDPLPVTVVPTSQVALVTPAPDSSLPPAPAESWQTLPLSIGPNGGRLIEAVTTEGTGLVGVGRGGCLPVGAQDPTDCFGAAWTAGADWSWSEVADHHGLQVGLAFPTSGPEKGLYDVASGPNGLVAIGYPYEGDNVGLPGIWRSSDPQVWERVAVTFGPSELGVRVSAITASERGYVIVGWVVTNIPVEGGAITARAAAWVSGDGTTWTRADDTPDMDVGRCVDTTEEPVCGGMLGVSPNGEGFVAVGYSLTEDDGVRPAAWASANGLTWTRSDTSRLDFSGFLSGVVEGATGLVAVGSICLPECASPHAGGFAASSIDGLRWDATQVITSPALGAVASTGSEVFAVGMLQGDGMESTLQVWRSLDGVAWSRVSDPPAIPDLTSYRSIDIAASGDRLIVVGWAETSDAEGWRNFAFAASTAAPSGELAPIPTATPPPSVPVATAIDAEMELRVEIRPDVSVGRMPMMTVYRDGTVLRRGNLGGTITRLDADGLERLLAEATDSGLFAASGELDTDPTYNGGFATYTIELRRGSEIIRRQTTNAMAPAVRAEGERLIALAEHLADLEAWLPADAWAVGPDAAEPYLASNYLLKVSTLKQPGAEYPPADMDLSDVVWPFPGSLAGFGEVDEGQPMGSGTSSRCGALTLTEATAVQRALAEAPWTSMGDRLVAELDWGDTGHVSVSLISLLPDDPIDCAVDNSWP